MKSQSYQHIQMEQIGMTTMSVKEYRLAHSDYRWNPVSVQDGESGTLDAEYELQLRSIVNVKSEIVTNTLNDISNSHITDDKPSTKHVQSVQHTSVSIMNFDKRGLHIANINICHIKPKLDDF